MIQGVIQQLHSSDAVKQCIGKNKALTRWKIYPVWADADEIPPFSVVSITGNSPNQCKDGASKMDKVRFQIITYTTSYEDLDMIDNAIRFALDGYKGTSASIPMSVAFTNHQDARVEGKNYTARISDYEALVTRTL